MTVVVRTPDERFTDLPGYPWEPRYVVIEDDVGPLRMHHVDAGPPDADPVLLLHGQPTWSYLYRSVIAELAARGHRVIAPDYIGYGRSDKVTDRFAYTLASHIRWMVEFVGALDLERATVVVQDWGGPIGFGLIAAEGDRFARVVAADTVLHTCEPGLGDSLTWANHSTGDGRVVIEEALLDWMLATQRERDLSAGAIVQSITARELTPREVAAYDAPYPDESTRVGLRHMNTLIPVTPNSPSAVVCRATFAALREWRRPFLTVWGADDPGTQGFETVFQAHVPGAAGQPHQIVAGSGHFIQEDAGPEFAAIISEFIAANPAG